LKVTQADQLNPIRSLENAGVHLVRRLGRGVGREQSAGRILGLWEALAVTVNRAGRRVDDSRDARIASSHEDIEEAVHVHMTARQRIVNRPRNRSERCLMKDEIHTGACVVARLEISNIRLDQPKPRTGVRPRPQHGIEVLSAPCREVVESDDGLAQVQQRFEEVGPDESRNPGDEPDLWLGNELVLQALIRGVQLERGIRVGHETMSGNKSVKPSTVTDLCDSRTYQMNARKIVFCAGVSPTFSRNFTMAKGGTPAGATVVQARTTANINRSVPPNYPVDVDQSKL
jgi:hypothetical protein